MAGANVMWGLMSPVSKAVMASGLVSSLLLTDFRIVGAAAAFWTASFFTRREHVPHADMMRLFFAAMLGIVLNQGSFVMGLGMTSPVDASIITTTTPIIVMILAALFLKEPVTGLKVLGIFFGALGALMLILGGAADPASAGGSNPWGNLLCFFAQCSYSAYFVLYKDLISRYSAITLMKWMFTYASIAIIPFSYSELATARWEAMGGVEIGGSAFVVLGATFLSYLLIPIGQHALRPTVACMYNYVQPIVASLVAVALGIAGLGWLKIVAIVLVFTGVYMVTHSKSRAQMEARRKAREAGAGK